MLASGKPDRQLIKDLAADRATADFPAR